MKTFHEKWYAGEVISVGIGQGAVEVTPIQLVRALSGIASDGHMVRPHVVNLEQLPGTYRQAVLDTFTGAGVKASFAGLGYMDDGDRRDGAGDATGSLSHR